MDIDKKIAKWESFLSGSHYSLKIREALEQCIDQLKECRKNYHTLSDAQVNAVESIEWLEQDVVKRCAQARKEILFHEQD